MKLKKLLLKVKSFIQKNPWSVFLTLLGLFIFAFLAWDIYTARGSLDQVLVPEEAKEPKLFAAPYSGIMVEEAKLNRRPLAVMIENHQNSRPQSGLNEADLVFEAVAEGGITRLLAIYHSKDAAEIGPVRSARNYYVEWADSYDALYAYVGGSQEALNLINRLGVASLNQFSLDNYFWRDQGRYAPHNVFTTSENLYAAAKSKGHNLKIENTPGYKFKKNQTSELRPEAQQFTVDYNGSYNPTYIYDPNCNCYNRSLLGVIQKDRKSNKNITANNVIVAFNQVGSTRIRNTTYTTINTTGSGQAYIYRDGSRVVGSWKREPGKLIRFYDDQSNEIELNVGTTWVSVVGVGTRIY